jgi:hypothetical protein
LLAEWRRRREACRTALAQARATGDLAAYRDLKELWDRYYAEDRNY